MEIHIHMHQERESHAVDVYQVFPGTYRESSKLSTRTSRDNQTFYIRSDGATSVFADDLDNPMMVCR